MKKIIPLLLVLIAMTVPGVGARAGTRTTPVASSKAAFSKGATFSESRLDMQGGRLARITAYWPGEDYYTNRKMSATGLRLRTGCCAVDSSIIPYGSVVKIPDLGSYLAVDTGSAVISRRAARLAGHTFQERSAMVIDLFFASRQAGELFSREGPKFAMVAWETGPSLASK